MLKPSLVSLNIIQIKIITSLESQDYYILEDNSIKFIKVLNDTFNNLLRLKNTTSPCNDYKRLLYKILCIIVNLMTKIQKILDTDKNNKHKTCFIKGLEQLHIQKENYIYVLRN